MSPLILLTGLAWPFAKPYISLLSLYIKGLGGNISTEESSKFQAFSEVDTAEPSWLYSLSSPPL